VDALTRPALVVVSREGWGVMANKPINRYEVQYVFPGGGYMRWESKGHDRTPGELVVQLREMADLIEKNEKRTASSSPVSTEGQ
jgi:hypothetical protein